MSDRTWKANTQGMIHQCKSFLHCVSVSVLFWASQWRQKTSARTCSFILDCRREVPWNLVEQSPTELCRAAAMCNLTAMWTGIFVAKIYCSLLSMETQVHCSFLYKKWEIETRKRKLLILVLPRASDRKYLNSLHPACSSFPMHRNEYRVAEIFVQQ